MYLDTPREETRSIDFLKRDCKSNCICTNSNPIGWE